MRVLVIKLGALGDLLISGAHVERIAAHHSGDEIWLLTSPALVEVARLFPGVRVRAFPRRGVRAMAAASAWVRRMRFEVVYDLQGSDRSRWLTWVSGARRRVALSGRFPYNVWPRHDHRHLHPFDRLNDLLEAAGIGPATAACRLVPGEEARRAVGRWLSAAGLVGAPLALFHAGSSPRWLSKRWPPAYFAAVAREVERRGIRVVWIGTAAEGDLNRDLAAVAGVDATGVFSPETLCALAGHARFALVNDSGPMHLLASSGLPVYAFFGPTDWRRCHAVGQAERIFRLELPCAPCYLPVCPTSRAHACMRKLEPEIVLERLRHDALI